MTMAIINVIYMNYLKKINLNVFKNLIVQNCKDIITIKKPLNVYFAKRIVQAA